MLVSDRSAFAAVSAHKGNGSGFAGLTVSPFAIRWQMTTPQSGFFVSFLIQSALMSRFAPCIVVVVLIRFDVATDSAFQFLRVLPFLVRRVKLQLASTPLQVQQANSDSQTPFDFYWCVPWCCDESFRLIDAMRLCDAMAGGTQRCCCASP